MSTDDNISLIAVKSKYNIMASEYNITIIQRMMKQRRQLLEQMKYLKKQIDKYE